jgi:hypothetical protein
MRKRESKRGRQLEVAPAVSDIEAQGALDALLARVLAPPRLSRGFGSRLASALARSGVSTIRRGADLEHGRTESLDDI